MTITESDYKTAQLSRKPLEIQGFLNEIHIDRDVVDRVQYAMNEAGGIGFRVMNGSILTPREGTREIVITPEAFEKDYTIFMNEILFNAQHKAKQFNYHPWHITFSKLFRRGEKNQEYFGIVCEIPAMFNQMSATGEFELPNKEKDRVDRQIRESEIRAKALGNLVHRNLRKELKKVLCPSPYDDAVRTKYNL